MTFQIDDWVVCPKNPSNSVGHNHPSFTISMEEYIGKPFQITSKTTLSGILYYRGGLNRHALDYFWWLEDWIVHQFPPNPNDYPYQHVIRKIKQMDAKRKEAGYAF